MGEQNGVLEVGTILSSRYEILRVIGHGGFGTVYMARQLNMNRDVAVKVLPAQFLSMENVVERFRREAKLASRLSHPNTITLFDYGRDGNSLFIVMELLKGKDLADLLQEEQKCDPLRVVKIISQVLRSLREAHLYGIVHRDLKPENIFVSSVSGEEDVVKVLDFGIAQFASSDLEQEQESASGGSRKLTRTGSTIGTPAYMSPEQAAGDHLTNRSDLYSLGVIMYELVAGRLPFPGDDMIKTMRAHLFEDVPPLDVPGVSGTPLEFVIMRALEKEPDKRFQSAEEMLRALEATPEMDMLPPFTTGKYSRHSDLNLMQAQTVTQNVVSSPMNMTPSMAHAMNMSSEVTQERIPLGAPSVVTQPVEVREPVISVQKILSFRQQPFLVMEPVAATDASLPTGNAYYWDWEELFPYNHGGRGEEAPARSEYQTISTVLAIVTIILLLGILTVILMRLF